MAWQKDFFGNKNPFLRNVNFSVKSEGNNIKSTIAWRGDSFLEL